MVFLERKELEKTVTTALGLLKKGNIHLAEQLLQATYDKIENKHLTTKRSAQDIRKTIGIKSLTGKK